MQCVFCWYRLFSSCSTHTPRRISSYSINSTQCIMTYPHIDIDFTIHTIKYHHTDIDVTKHTMVDQRHGTNVPTHAMTQRQGMDVTEYSRKYQHAMDDITVVTRCMLHGIDVNLQCFTSYSMALHCTPHCLQQNLIDAQYNTIQPYNTAQYKKKMSQTHSTIQPNPMQSPSTWSARNLHHHTAANRDHSQPQPATATLRICPLTSACFRRALECVYAGACM